MSSLIEKIDDKYYPQFSRNWDDNLFRERILAQLRPAMTILDLGAGAGIVPQMNFKGHVQMVCGVDLDNRVVTNPLLDEGRIADANSIPYPDQSFDLVFSDNVVEHLEDPAAVFGEVSRVLKSGGIFLFKTPNKHHYMPAIARATPHRVHQFFNRLRGREETDTFPTLYRAKTIPEVSAVASELGFEVSALELIEGRPEYLRISWFTYLFGLAYERLVNYTESLARFRILLIAEIRKP